MTPLFIKGSKLATARKKTEPNKPNRKILFSLSNRTFGLRTVTLIAFVTVIDLDSKILDQKSD